MKGKFGHGMMIENLFETEREQAEEQRRREAETEELRAQLHKAMEDLANARENEGFLAGQVDSLTQQVSDKDAEIHIAHKNLLTEREQSGMLAQQVRQLADNNEALKKQLEEAYAVIDQMAEAHACLQGQYADLENTLETREREFQYCMANAEGHIEMLKKANAVVARGAAVTETYTVVQKELKTFIPPQGAVDPAVVNEEAPPQRELDRLQAEVDSLKLKNTQLENQLKTRKVQFGEMATEMDHLANEVTCGLLPNPLDGTTQGGFASSPMQDNSELQKKIDELERTVRILTTERDQARGEQAAMEEEQKKLGDEITVLQEASDTIGKLQSTVDTLTTERDQLQEQVELLTHENDSLNGALEVAREDIDKIEAEQVRLQEQIDGYEGAMEQMKNTLTL